MTATARILEIVDAFQPEGTLRDAFADGYLLRNSPVFRGIRTFLLQQGYRFESDGPLSMEYRSAPLLALPRILSSKTVPYMANGRALRELAGQTRLQALQPEDLEFLLAKNELLHESAHCFAEHFLPMPGKECQGSGTEIVRSMVAESFANAAELVAVLETRSELERWLMGFHTHHTAPTWLRNAFRSFLVRHGRRSAIQWLIWAFLRINLLQDSESAQATWMTMAADSISLASDWDTPEATGLFNYAVNLNPRFRTETARIFFNVFFGINDVVKEIASIDLTPHEIGCVGSWIRILAECLDHPE